MFQSLGSVAAVDLSIVCDANGQNCEPVRTPTGPGPSMPTGPQPPNTVLACDYTTEPGQCYYAPNTPNTTAGQKVAAAQGKDLFLGMSTNTLVLAGFAALIGIGILTSGRR